MRIQHKNAQRYRRQQERLAEDFESEEALDKCLEGLRTGGASASDSARMLSRMCAIADRRDECGRRGAVPLIVEAMAGGGVDATLCCRSLSRLCAGRADLQVQAVESGALTALISHLQHADTSALVLSSCRALEHMATGRDAASRREAAATAGSLPALVTAMRRWGEEEATRAACSAALRSLTRDSVGLQEAATKAGAEPQWLL